MTAVQPDVPSSTTPRTPGLVWRQIHWSRPVDALACLRLLRAWAADERSPRIVLEAHGSASGIAYLLGVGPAQLAEVASAVTGLVPGTRLTGLPGPRASVTAARRIKASTRHRALRSDDVLGSARSVLTALSAVREGEHLVLQVVLGPRRVPLSVPTNSPSSVVAPWWLVAWHGNGGQIDAEKRTALRNKVSDHGFACAVRLGVHADSPQRRHSLLLGLVAAIRTAESSGLRLRHKGVGWQRVNTASVPRCGWGWGLRLNVAEILAVTGWPVSGPGDDDLPGQPALHPKLLPPAPGTTATASGARVVARATAPGIEAQLTLSARDALQHSHILGPTGVGKSVLLGRLIEQDITAGRAVVVIEPKGDLVEDVLAHIPPNRQADVVVLDPSDAAPVGLNPLATGSGAGSALLADAMLSVFRALYVDSWGPRTQDILHASLLTLTRRPDASLVMLPLLLTNQGFRRSFTRRLDDPVALGPFWAWYDNLSDAERGAVIAPVMNKLRPWLLNPTLRGVLGQRQPRFALREVFTRRRILLVPLRSGVVGPEIARLLGSLLVAGLWQTSLSRTAVAPEKRHPVMVYIDEVQDYLHLPTDLGDALAQARGLGVGFTLAHQFLSQLSLTMRAGLLANARSRVCFQLSHEDAAALSKGHPELTADDFTALGQHEVYASLFAGGRVTPYASGTTLPPGPALSDPNKLRASSRERYGRPLADISAEFAELAASSAGSAVSDQSVGRRRRA